VLPGMPGGCRGNPSGGLIVEKMYTDNEATDAAVRLAMRRLGRLYPTVHADLMSRLPTGVREALNMADVRADKLIAQDERDGIQRAYPPMFDEAEQG
jgi:hypothetical protein